ncbi:P-type conjugative transfer protein TrbJ [Sphingosinicella soli]|uniref:P-type conjugative transfer protein TrbJ n=1 Tax=Sphingosinicella soli TaxID=333708 RepID=A0A7W7B318_9SPHN|nr:P-type conjugative transfer protein TrbJ [Sphingosinicella soli]MBB4633114.1 P-type conjugative transfer protein TrbJ [Sphingosinicella soli]
MKTRLRAWLLRGAFSSALGALTLTLPAPAHAIPVFDSANYAQNLLVAARTLAQINNQIQSLQNEALMLTNMAKNLSRTAFPEVDALTSRLAEIDALMKHAHGIGFDVAKFEERFQTLFPESYDEAAGSAAHVFAARDRLDASMAAFRHTMDVQNRIAADVEANAEVLSAIIARSQDAEGSLQAQQSTNQLLALAAKQQLQTQQMLAAQFRSESAELARRAQAESDARAATRAFLGSGKAYE